MWHENKTRKKKCVTRLILRVSPVPGHSYDTEWIQRLKEFGCQD